MNKLYLLVGASGSGKTTIAESMKIPCIVSHTTRQPRTGEVNGKDYYFVSNEAFESIDMIEETVYAGNKYGGSKCEVDSKLSTGNCVCVVDRHGAKAFKDMYGEQAVIIFVKTESQRCKLRMVLRGSDEALVSSRVSHAIDNGEFVDFELADYTVDNSGCFSSTMQQVMAVMNSD